MQPDEPLDKVFYVATSAGVAVLGLVTGDFTVTAWHTPAGGSTATWTHGLVVSELGTGWYRARFTLPAAGQWFLQVAHATHVVTPWGWEDQLQNYDADAIAALVASPVVTVLGSGTLGGVAALPTIICKRKAVIVLAVVDENGDPAPIDVGYTSWKVGFRNQADQSLTPPKLDAIHGTPTDFGLVITAGLITITIPDNCSIFTPMVEGVSPTDQMTLDMEVTAEQPAGQTVAIVAPSPLIITKRAEGS